MIGTRSRHAFERHKVLKPKMPKHLANPANATKCKHYFNPGILADSFITCSSPSTLNPNVGP